MLDDLRKLAGRNGFVVVTEHTDDGISGAVRDRPQFTAWLDDAREGRAEVLMAWHVDRMTREGLPVAALLLDVVEGRDRDGKPAHAPVRLMDAHGLDSARGESFRLEFVIKAEIARAERERMKARGVARAERLARAGRWHGGPTCFGYVAVDAPDGKGKVLAINEPEAAAVRRAAEMILDGRTPGDVARWLTAEGFLPRLAGKRKRKHDAPPQWSRRAVIRLLTGDGVLGRITHRGAPMRDGDGNAFAPFPRILDLGTARSVRAALSPKREGPRNAGGALPSRLLSGLIICHSCRRPLLASNKANKYRCASRGLGFTCAEPVCVSAARADKTVEAALLAKSGSSRLYERRVLAADDGVLAAVEDRHAAVLAQLGHAPTAELFATLQELTGQREELAARPRTTTIVLADTGLNVAEEWAQLDLAGRRELLGNRLESLVLLGAHGRTTFDPARLAITWRPPVTEEDFMGDADVILGTGQILADLPSGPVRFRTGGAWTSLEDDWATADEDWEGVVSQHG